MVRPSGGLGAESVRAVDRLGPADDIEHERRVDPAAIGPDELARQYGEYRVRQARSLLGLLPTEAIRPLYRRARSEEPSGDPMAALLAYCEALLPLPPFEVWLDDLRCRPEAHWHDLESSADAPSATKPVTIDGRRFARGPSEWIARLRGFRDQDVWRGFIAFEVHGVARPRVHRTTLIFREATLTDMRDRFHGFESASLEAFLRSALP